MIVHFPYQMKQKCRLKQCKNCKKKQIKGTYQKKTPDGKLPGKTLAAARAEVLTLKFAILCKIGVERVEIMFDLRFSADLTCVFKRKFYKIVR